MAENKDINLGELEKLALIAESCQTIFSGKATIVLLTTSEKWIDITNNSP